MNIFKYWLPVLLGTVIGAMTIDIHFSANVFSLLPSGSDTVIGLKRYQNQFGSSQAVILALQGDTEASTRENAKTLAQLLQDKKLATDVAWRSPFEDQKGLAEILAYMWLNQPPKNFNEMLSRFDDEEHLTLVLERIATSFNAQEVARLANDPFELTSVGKNISANSGRDLFASEDGLLRILYASYPQENPSFWEYKEWLAQIDSVVNESKATGELSENLSIRSTGNPVFITEFGSRLLRDLVLAALSTLLLVMLLFWWAHRRWSPLFWLVLLLLTTVTITVLVGSLIFGSLSVVSLGFAAILLGLTVDYGLIVYQEYRTNPQRSPSQMRRILAPSILWAAVTTAGAFLMLARSSLPGLHQLGVLVAIGILTAALLVLVLYVISLRLSVEADRNNQAHSVSTRSGAFEVGRRVFWPVTIVSVLGSVMILIFVRPTINTDVAALQFQNVKAQQVNREVQSEITGSESDLWIIVDGRNEQQIERRLQDANTVLQLSQQSGLKISVNLPDNLWPKRATQTVNQTNLRSLLSKRDTILSQVFDAGFAEDSMVLTEAVFTVWQGYLKSNDRIIWPQSQSVRWLFRQFASHGENGMLALGKVSLGDSVSQVQLQQLADELSNIEGVKLVGWSLLANSLATTIVTDARKVVLPMLAVLVVLLGLAFRDLRDIGLSFATLAFSMVCLTAAMPLLGWTWNIMNMTALPLLLGAGVDYSIHIQLALKRYQGDLVKVYKSVGTAILLCGASTVAAFTSLSFASNPGIASLGQVAAFGIAITCVTAVFLLPGWWLAARGREFTNSAPKI